MPDFLRELRSQIGPAPILLPSAAAVVRNQAGHILCMLRADTGEWSLPSGICEPGEQPARTIARELYEEAGIVVRPERIVAVTGGIHAEYPNGDVADYVSILFECRWISGTPEPRDGEALDVRFFPPDGLPFIRMLEQIDVDLRDMTGEAAAFRWHDAWLPDDLPNGS